MYKERATHFGLLCKKSKNSNVIAKTRNSYGVKCKLFFLGHATKSELQALFFHDFHTNSLQTSSWLSFPS